MKYAIFSNRRDNNHPEYFCQPPMFHVKEFFFVGNRWSFFARGGVAVIVSAVYGHWLYSKTFLGNFGSVFQFACPPLYHAYNLCINFFA